MKKIIMVGRVPCGYPDALRNFHIRIEYTEGKLSMVGVVGAMSNGDARGGCGQCVDELDRVTEPAEGFDVETLKRLKETWERWHLNDLRAECEHQRALGWREKAAEAVTLYHWKMTAALKLQKQAERAAAEALRAGETFTPTQEQAFYVALPYSLTTHTAELPANTAEHYEPKKPLYPGDGGHTETKTLGWLYPSNYEGNKYGGLEHPEGLLCAPCPVCGYKRGSSWQREEVPEDVIKWLFSLPSASVACPWRNL